MSTSLIKKGAWGRKRPNPRSKENLHGKRNYQIEGLSTRLRRIQAQNQEKKTKRRKNHKRMKGATAELKKGELCLLKCNTKGAPGGEGRGPVLLIKSGSRTGCS